jgi:hypothetical protein
MQASASGATEDKKMRIDISFGWKPTDRADDGDTEQNNVTQDQGDCDITRPVSILTLVDDPSPVAEKKMDGDPYNNGYWLKLPLD